MKNILEIGGMATYNDGVGQPCHAALGGMGGRNEWVLDKVGVPFPTTIDSKTIASIQHQVRITTKIIARVVLLINREQGANVLAKTKEAFGCSFQKLNRLAMMRYLFEGQVGVLVHRRYADGAGAKAVPVFVLGRRE
jgi:hypothetical protein